MTADTPAGAVLPVRASAASVRQRVGLAALAAVALALPLALSDYQTFQLTLALSYAIALLGLNMLTGFSGQISLGHGAFYAIGAYVTAILMDRWDWSCWATLPVSALVCLAAGFLFGLPALRLEGLYLALATFALAVATPQILKSKLLEGWTGGVQGISIIKPDPPDWLPIGADPWLYYLTLAVTALMFLGARNLLAGRIGRALRAIRDHGTAAEAMGIHTARYKALIFGVSALYTGVAGSLGAISVQFVAPDSFSAFLSISLLVGLVVGGLGAISGAIWGALFIQFVPNLADHVSKAAPWAIYGLFLIGCMYVMPTGVAGALRLAARRLRRRPTDS